jgi:hypothetical protein
MITDDDPAMVLMLAAVTRYRAASRVSAEIMRIR